MFRVRHVKLVCLHPSCNCSKSTCRTAVGYCVRMAHLVSLISAVAKKSVLHGPSHALSNHVGHLKSLNAAPISSCLTWAAFSVAALSLQNLLSWLLLPDLFQLCLCTITCLRTCCTLLYWCGCLDHLTVCIVITLCT